MPPKTLLERCRDEIVPQPVLFNIDDDGGWHFATDAMPLRTVIDTHNLMPFGNWLRLDMLRGIVTMTLDGRTVSYKRVRTTLHGEWMCDMVRDDPFKKDDPAC